MKETKNRNKNEISKKTGEQRMNVFAKTNVVQKTKSIKDFMQEEDGMGTVEIILIVVVLVGLVLIFKKQMTGIVNNLFEKITQQTNNF